VSWNRSRAVSMATTSAHVMSAKQLNLTFDEHTIRSASSWAQRATQDARLPRLPVLAHPCGDCAVTGLFYLDEARSLAGQPEPIRSIVASRWFCHDATNRACRGLHDVIENHDFRRVASRWLRLLNRGVPG
jgi:hypothetical protein